MARARRKNGSERPEGEGKPVARAMPAVCPLCQESLPRVFLDATAHLQSHAPAMLCRRCDATDKGWRLDWDLVKYPRPDVNLFFCTGCGRYAPMEG